MATVAVEPPHTNGFLDSVTTANGDEVKEQTPFAVWDEHVEGKAADKAADVSTDDHIVTATEADDSAVPTSSTDTFAQEIQHILAQNAVKDTIEVKTFTEPQEADNKELNSDKLPISQDAAETTTEANVIPESTPVEFKENSASFDSSIASELLDTPAEESNGPEPLLETLIVEPKSVEDDTAPSVAEPPVEQTEEVLAPTVTKEEAEEPVAAEVVAEHAATEAPVEQVEQTVAPVLTLQEDEPASAAPIPTAVDAPEVEEIASLPTTTEEAEPEAVVPAEVTADAPVDTTGTEDIQEEELPVEVATALETQDESSIPPAAETTPLKPDIEEDSTAEVPTEVETKEDAAIEEAPISIEQPTSIVEEEPGVQEDITSVVADSDLVPATEAATPAAEAEDAIAEPSADLAEVEVESDVTPQEVVDQVPEPTIVEEDAPATVDAAPVPADIDTHAATEAETETVPVTEVEVSEEEVVKSEAVVPEAAAEALNVPEVTEEETPIAVDEPTPEEAPTVVAEPILEAEAAPVVEDTEPVLVEKEVSEDVPAVAVAITSEAEAVETPSVSAVADEEDAHIVVDEPASAVEASEAVVELDAAPVTEAEVEPEPVAVEDEVVQSEAVVPATPEDEPTSVLAIADEEIPVAVAEPTPATLVDEPISEAVAPVEEEPPVETEVLANEPSLEDVPTDVASTPAELADDVEDKSTVVVEPVSAPVTETPALAEAISEPEPVPVAEPPVETTDVAAEAPAQDPVVAAELVPEPLQVDDNLTGEVQEEEHVAEAEEVKELPDTAQEVPVDAEVDAPVISDGAVEEVESVEVQSSVDASVAADEPVAEIAPIVEEEPVDVKEEEVEEPSVADTPAIEEIPAVPAAEAAVVDVPVEIASEITELVEEDVPPTEQLSETEETVAALVDDTAAPADEETSVPDVDIAPPVAAIVAEETAPFVEESTEASVEDEPVVPTIDEPSAEEIATEVPSLSIDTAPETRSLSPASEIERPKSPWTPSYSVTSQGPGIAPEEDITAIEEDISPPVEAPPSPIPEVAITLVDGSEPEALQAPLEDVVRPTSPWTPSYSVSVQGSPALKPIELDEPVDVEPLDSPWGDVPENSETQEINESDESAKDHAPEVTSVPVLVEDVLAVEVPVAFAPEVPAESEISEPSLLTPEPQAEIERPASPWTPSYSVSQQGTTSTDALVPEEVDQEVVVSPPVEERVVQVTPAETKEEEEEPETKVSDIQPEIERPASPWIPSYTVTRSTEDLAETEATEEDDTVPVVVDSAVPEESSAKLLSSESPAEISRPASPWTPSYSVNQQGSKSSEALDKEVAAEEETIATVDEPIVNVVDTTPEDASKEDAVLNIAAEIPRPWTPSYSVNQQGSGTSTPAVEKEADEIIAAAEAPAVVELEATTEPSVELETQTPEVPVVEEAPSVSEDASIVGTERPELSAPAEIERPWTPSYSVIQQGSATPEPQANVEVEVDEEEQVFEDVQESAPAQTAPVESLTAPLSLKVPVHGSPWTPSYSVTSQGPASPSLGYLPVLDDETSREEAKASTAEESDTLEPLPSSPLPGVAFPHSTTRDADLTSLDTISSQPGGSEEKRKRIESTISTASSRFFPGGWFSKPSPTTEPRQSIESASGEFTPAKIDPAAPEGSGAHEPQADDSTDEDEDEDDEEIKDEKKGGRWCVVM